MKYQEWINNYYNPNVYDLAYYDITGYNGYRISETGILITYKNYKVEPMGHPLKSKVDKNNDVYYIISNDQNERKKVYVDELLSLARMDKPHGLYDGTFEPRNKLTRKKHTRFDQETYTIPSFSNLIIDNNKPELKVPVKFF